MFSFIIIYFLYFYKQSQTDQCVQLNNAQTARVVHENNFVGTINTVEIHAWFAFDTFCKVMGKDSTREMINRGTVKKKERRVRKGEREAGEKRITRIRVVNVSLGKTLWTRKDIRAHFRRVARKHELLPVRGTFSTGAPAIPIKCTGHDWNKIITWLGIMHWYMYWYILLRNTLRYNSRA